MKKWLFRIITSLLIAVGMYGVIRCGFFLNNEVFSVSRERSNQEYISIIKPQVDTNYAKLNLDGLSENEKTNLQKLIQWQVIDNQIRKHESLGIDVFLFSFVVSLFSILLGLNILIFGKLHTIDKPKTDNALH
jgi:hypothetical protein